MKSGLITQRTLVQIPGQEGNFCPSKSTTSPPICKTGTCMVLYFGTKYTGCASLTANGTGGTSGAHTCSGRYSQYSCELLAWAPGDCIASAHSACLVHRCPGLPGMRDHLVAVKNFAFVCGECVCMRACV